MSVWNQNRQGGGPGPRHALGLWLPMRKLASAAEMPGAAERRKLYGKTPFSYCFNFSLFPNGVGNDRVTVLSDFFWTTIAASGVQPPATPGNVSFSVALFETKSKRRYMNNPLICAGNNAPPNQNGSTFGAYDPGTGGASTGPAAGVPYYQRRITTIPKGAVLLMKVQLLPLPAPPVTGSAIQVVLGGYID
jgi:hypothetical protein